MNRYAHVVHIDRRHAFTSATLDAGALNQLETTFRAVRWWRDKWRDRLFRETARRIAQEHGGLALVGPGMSFDVPPPFTEQFEPIEIGRGFGDERARLETLSGSAPTRQEWIVRKVLIPLGVIALVALLVALFHYRFQPPRVVLFVVVGSALSALVPISVIALVRRLRNRWYLLPGAIAIFRRPPRRGAPARVTVLSHDDTCLVLRYIHTGKTTVLMLELWTHLGRAYRSSVSEREAMSALAAWQSPLAPPPEERLHDLAVS